MRIRHRYGVAATAGMSADGDVSVEVARRGAVRAEHLRRLGLTGAAPESVRVFGDWWVHHATYDAWQRQQTG